MDGPRLWNSLPDYVVRALGLSQAVAQEFEAGGSRKKPGVSIIFCERSEQNFFLKTPIGGVKTLIYFPH